MRMSPALNGSSALEHFEHSNASEIRNGIMFDFYPGLPHLTIILLCWFRLTVLPSSGFRACSKGLLYVYKSSTISDTDSIALEQLLIGESSIQASF